MTITHYWKLMHNDLGIYNLTGLEEYLYYAQDSYKEYKRLGGRKNVKL